MLEAEALGEISKTLASLSRFGLLAEADVDTVCSRVSVVSARNIAVALTGAAIVFEAVPEVVDLKREVLVAASNARARSHHRLDDIDHPGRRPLRCGGTSRAVPQRALAQPGLPDPAGGNFAGDRDRSGCHRAGESAAGRHRQGAGGVRGYARFHCATHPGARHERGRANGGRRRRQRRGHRQGDPIRFWLPIRGAGAFGIHRLGRRRHSLLCQPLPGGRARQRPLSCAGGNLAKYARRPHRPAHRRRVSRLFRPRRRCLS